MYIYAIKNRINKKIYIGQTVRDPYIRFEEHCSPSSGCIALRNAIQKYGRQNFDLFILARVSSRERLNKLETKLIKKLNTIMPHGYNMKFEGAHSGIIYVPISTLEESTKEQIRIENRIKKNKKKKYLKVSDTKEIWTNRSFNANSIEPDFSDARQYALGMIFTMFELGYPIDCITQILVKAKINRLTGNPRWSNKLVEDMIVKYFFFQDDVFDVTVDYMSVLEDLLYENGHRIEVVSESS